MMKNLMYLNLKLKIFTMKENKYMKIIDIFHNDYN